MTNTLWSDISEFQRTVDDSYPYACLCIRSNDGDHLDGNFAANHAWCKRRRGNGHLFAFLVYYLYRPGIDGARILMNRVGKPDPRMVAMIDVESVGGQVAGNQSAAVNAQHDELAKWLGDRRRVVGYGNTSDLDDLWPSKPAGLRIITAAYGSNPAYPGKYAHQFTDAADTAPFGPSDLTSADGMSAAALLRMYGFTTGPEPANEHHFDGKTTIGDVAVSRSMTPTGWVAMQERLNPGDADKLLGDAVPRSGATWWTAK